MSGSPPEPEVLLPPRPLPATYWVVPGRFLVGEYPGSPSRADAMERLRRCLLAGITCFVDLTEPGELPSYESLLPFATPDGRRIEYLREPVRDHGVPASHEVVARVLATVDDALAAGHVVYLHCRAGIGRSATVVGCWLADQPQRGGDPLTQLQVLWQQSARASAWPLVPETQEQADFVRDWPRRVATGAGMPASGHALDDRIRGALLGLALGDATGECQRTGRTVATEWTQHTALALCLAESLLETGTSDARDQMGRYLRWQRDGHLAALAAPGTATPDVARVLASYRWRRLPMAGSHDPKDRSTSALPRVVSAAAFALDDPARAVALAAECARTTHQSPVVLDACRFFGALMVGTLRGGAPATVLRGLYDPVPGLWTERPLRSEVRAAFEPPAAAPALRGRGVEPDVVHAVANARAAVATATDVLQAIELAIETGCEPALDGALAGALAGAVWGAAGLPGEAVARLARLADLEQFAVRLAARHRARAAAPAESGA